MRDAASSLGLYLQGVSNNEMGAPLLQSVVDKIGFVSRERNTTGTLMTLSTIIRSKIVKFKETLENLVNIIDTEGGNITNADNFIRCCSIPAHQFKYDQHFGGAAVMSSLSCSHQSASTASSTQHRSNLTRVLQNNLETIPGLLWQYYINNDSREVVHPAWKQSVTACAPSPPVGHSRVYLKTLHRHTKRVVFIVDRSSALSSHQFGMSLATFRSMLSSLSNGDRVGVILISSNNPIIVDVKSSVSCDQGKLILMTDTIRTDLLSYIARIGQEGGAPDVPLGLTFAYNIIAKSDHRETEGVQIVFITGKKFEDKTEEELDEIIFEIRKQKRRMNGTLSLSFVMMQNIGQRMFPDRDFVQRMIEAGGPGGKIHSLQRTSLVSSLGDWYLVTSPDDQGPVLTSLPSVDEVSDTPTVTLSQRTVSGGVMALEISLAEIIQDIYWVERESVTRTFLMDVNGVTISHPDLSLKAVIKHLDIGLLEPLLSASSDRHEMLTVPSGSLEINNTEFSWNRLESTEYILVIVTDFSKSNSDMISRLAGVTSVHSGDYQHHSLLTMGNTKLCRHMSEAASMQTAALYLASAAFGRPADHLKADPTAGMRTQSYMAYLTDPTRLIANPGLRTGIRDEVAALGELVDKWKKQAYGSPLNNYIVRRRVISPRGVQLTYPGVGAREGTDPTLSPMFRTASMFPDLISLSPPHLDNLGAGYIVTMASVVTSSLDSPVAVIEADFTQGYFHKIVNDSLYGDLCHQENNTCFLMDHQGFLLTHPRLTYRDPKLTGLSVHLTHLEPGVATDLLSDKHPGLLIKSECRDHESGTRQRMFKLDIDTESVSGGEESCTQYSLERVAGTNLMLGLVTRTCQASPSFCWCSTVDRSCLDCSRLAQDECECPCECSEDREDVCGAAEVTEPLDTCPPMYNSPGQRSPRFSRIRVDQLPECVHTDCPSRASEADCTGVLGCSWCQLAEDAITPLSPEFCASLERCYSGILSYPSPYSLVSGQPHQTLASEAERRPAHRASPIGPVAGGIMAFFALLAVTGYAYRRWSRGERRLLVNTSDHERVIMDGGYEEDTPADDMTGGHNNYGLHQSSGISVVSPYRMNPGYRRPGRGPGTESDPGYSTMTPGGDADSEIMSCLGTGNTITTSRRQTEMLRGQAPASLKTASPSSCDPQIMMTNKIETRASSDEDEAGSTTGKMNDTNKAVLKEGGRNQIIVAATVHTVET